MKGDVHTYEEENINKEVVHIKIADFTYGYAFNAATLDNIVVMALA